MDSEVEVHILGSTETEDIQREIKIVSHKTFNGYIITLGAITPPEFNASIIHKNTPYTVFQDGTTKQWAEDVAVITGIKRNPSNVSAIYVPSVVEIDGKTYQVKVIGLSAFSGNPWITKIMFGEGIECFGYNFLSRLPRLTTVVLPSTTKCFEGACPGCDNVTSLTFPEGMTDIGISFIYGFSGLSGVVHLPASLEHIHKTSGGQATSQNITGYEVQSSNSHFKSVGGSLLSHDGHILYCIPTVYELYMTPRGVMILYPGVFYRHDRLKAIIIHDDVVLTFGSIFWHLPKCTLIYVSKHLITTLFTDGHEMSALKHFATAKTTLRYTTVPAEDKSKQQSSSSDDKNYALGWLYDAGGSALVMYPAGLKPLSIKIPSGVKTLRKGCLSHTPVGILDLGDVETLETACLNRVGRITQNDQHVGLTCRFSNKVKTLQSRAFHALSFNHFFMWPPPSGEDLPYMFHPDDHRLLVSKNKTTTTAASTDQKTTYTLINFLYPGDAIKSSAAVQELILPDDITACDTWPLTEYYHTLKRICFYKSGITQLTGDSISSINKNCKVVLPKSLSYISGGNAIHITGSSQPIDIPESVTRIVAQGMSVVHTSKLTFWSKKKNKVDTINGGSNDQYINIHNILTQVSSDCVIYGYKGSYAEDIASEYTLKFVELKDQSMPDPCTTCDAENCKYKPKAAK